MRRGFGWARVAAGIAAGLLIGALVLAAFGVPVRLALLRDRYLLIAASYAPDGLTRVLATMLALDAGRPLPLTPPADAGGPILVITAAANPFTGYLAEILRAEGLNEFSTLDVARLDPAALAGREVVVVGEMPLTAPAVAILTAWTEAGGTLIAMRPDRSLAPLLGLTAVAGTLGDGYLRIDGSRSPGRGIVDATMQFHGRADQWLVDAAPAETSGDTKGIAAVDPTALATGNPTGLATGNPTGLATGNPTGLATGNPTGLATINPTVLATLYADADTPTHFPAVTERAVGTHGGRAVAFAYDLARSVVYTRQGNPAWAGRQRHGIPPRRSVDLFFGDWLDFDKLAIPQADEQQRLLVNVILQQRPLPRFWYLPEGRNAAVVMTGDDHGDTGMRPRFDRYRDASPPGCSIDDWECVRATGYLYVGTTFTAADVERYTRLGFEVAPHVDTKCRDWSPTSLAFAVGLQLQQFARMFPAAPAPVSNRTHCAAWSDWSTEAEIEAAHGIRLDTNYYFYPESWTGGRAGLFTGSGFPMRFAARDGSPIDCYQAATQITDESGMALPAVCDALLERANGPEGFYGVVTANMHFDELEHPGSDAIVASARAHGAPVISARQLLEWLDGRNTSSFRAVTRADGVLAFTIAVGTGARHLRAMIPTRAPAGALSAIEHGAVPVTYRVRTIKGIEYAFFAAEAGAYVARYDAGVMN